MLIENTDGCYDAFKTTTTFPKRVRKKEITKVKMHPMQMYKKYLRAKKETVIDKFLLLLKMRNLNYKKIIIC